MGMFKYSIDMLPNQIIQFVRNYRKANKNCVLKQDGKAIYCYQKGGKELDWKWVKDDMKLYSDFKTKEIFGYLHG